MIFTVFSNWTSPLTPTAAGESGIVISQGNWGSEEWKNFPWQRQDWSQAWAQSFLQIPPLKTVAGNLAHGARSHFYLWLGAWTDSTCLKRVRSARICCQGATGRTWDGVRAKSMWEVTLEPSKGHWEFLRWCLGEVDSKDQGHHGRTVNWQLFMMSLSDYWNTPLCHC